MYNVKGLDLSYKTGYINGYTLYATKSIGQLQVELDIAWCCETNDTELSYENRMWFLGYMEGIEYALYLKRMQEVNG